MCKTEETLKHLAGVEWEEELERFTDAFIDCLLWSEMDNEGRYPLNENYSTDNIDSFSLDEIESDCKQFLLANWDMIIDHLPAAGYDFCLTRNGHGAGFWDGDWPEYGDELTESAQSFGTLGLYVGDDGILYHHG